MNRRPRRHTASATTVLGLMLLAAPAASAHDYPVAHQPTQNAVVTTQPGHVGVTFNDFVLTTPAPPELVVTGPDGQHYETGCAHLETRTVRVPAALGPDGRYTVTWRVVSADGHPVSGTSSFSFTAGQAVHRAAGRASAPACGHSGETASKSTPGSDAAPLIVAGIAVGGAVLGVVAVVVRNRRRGGDSENETSRAHTDGETHRS